MRRGLFVTRKSPLVGLRFGLKRRVRSPADGCADDGAVEAEILDAAVGCEVVGEVAPSSEDVVAAEAVADATERLPGQIGIACADVGVVLNEPVALGAEIVAAF